MKQGPTVWVTREMLIYVPGLVFERPGWRSGWPQHFALVPGTSIDRAWARVRAAGVELRRRLALAALALMGEDLVRADDEVDW